MEVGYHNSPRISIIIPTADHPEDVRRCLENLTVLTYPDWEAIVVDQSAGAGTQAVVEDYLPCLLDSVLSSGGKATVASCA